MSLATVTTTSMGIIGHQVQLEANSLSRSLPGLIGRFAALWVMLLVGACGGGGGAGAAVEGPQAVDDYFPLHVGDVRYFTDAGGGLVELRVTGTRMVGGRNVFVLVDTDASGSSEALYEKTSDGVVTVPATGATALDIALARIPVLPLPLTVGETRVPLDQGGFDVGDLDGDGRADYASLRAEMTVVGLESLKTPAGSWSNVAHVRTMITEIVALSATNGSVTVVGTLDDWYAPSVGLVRSEYSFVGPGGSQGDLLTLKAFHVGEVRSETVTPTIAARSPRADSVVRDMTLGVTFSEAMDRHELPTDAFKLTGPDGQPVAGAVSWQDDRSLNFVPAGALSSGTYVAGVSGDLRDLAGNPVSGDLTWTFSLDRQGPVVVSMAPANGAVEVPFDALISIVFDEAPDPASITAATVQLHGASGLVETKLALSGRTLTVTPRFPLERAQGYRVVVYGVRDGVGNVNLVGTESTFVADAGRFAPAQQLGGLELVSQPELIADINGDGRKDYLLLGAVTNASGTAIFVYRQQTDGTLAPPERLAIQSKCSVVDAMAADLDGSGRSAIVVSHLCGMEILRQTADGRLVTSAVIEVPPVVHHMAVLRGSGRPGIVGLSDAAATAGFDPPRVWRQDAAGNFALPVTVPIRLRDFYRLHTADMDGNGLDDLVLLGLLSSETSHGIEVIPQHADGSFGPSREIAVDYCGGASGVATGDFNGDGRMDLALISTCLGEGRVIILRQDSTGDFAALPPLATASNLEGVWTADIDGDGRPDLVTVHDTLGVGVLLQRPDGSMAPEVVYRSPTRASAVTTGDVTGDGLVDIVSGGYLLRQKPTPVGVNGLKPGKRDRGAMGALPRMARGSTTPAVR